MDPLRPITLRLRGRKLAVRLTFAVLLILAICAGAIGGLLFVYSSDLPEIHALQDYQPNVVTELYADDGQLIGTFSLQRRILITYDQIPPVLKDAILSTEDQHFEEHCGVDFTRVAGAAWKDIIHGRVEEGASTLTMQLAGTLFLNRADRSFRRKIQETLLARQIERHYTKEQMLTMYCNQIYLAHGNYGFEAASEYYFGKPISQLTLPEAATLAGLIRGPGYSPILHPQKSLDPRHLVLERMATLGKISDAAAQSAIAQPMGLNLEVPRDDLAPYFGEEIRKYLEGTYGTETVDTRGLRVYTTLNVAMQRAANQAVRDGLHAYDRRHGWRGHLDNILSDNRSALAAYEDDDWRGALVPGAYVHGLVIAVDEKAAILKIGPYRATLSPADFAWTGRRSPGALLTVGDLAMVHIVSLADGTAKVTLEQAPGSQAAVLEIDNPPGGIKASGG